jgi:hypothetical protein
MFEYLVVTPPFTLKFRQMSKKELENYYRWFIDIIPQRIAILIRAVKSTPGFEDWEPDYLPVSLDKLGEWFKRQIETRARTDEEKQAILLNSPPQLKDIQIGDRELTNKTFSIAIDVGMYLSQVFLKNVQGLKWKQMLEVNKRSIDYGQPVFGSFGKINFNPVRMMVTQAYGIAHGTKNGTSLRQLYEIWDKLA